MSGHSIVTPIPLLPPPLETPEEAERWAEALVRDVEAARAAMNVSGDTPVRALKRLERAYLLKHGGALGAIGALLRTKHITAVAYNAFVERVRATLI